MLRRVTVSADTDVRVRPSAKLVRLSSSRIVRSSYPYGFQRPSKKLRYLRDNWRLDDVVASGKTEMERFVLLLKWVRRQWPCNDAGSGKRTWDAIEILSAPEGQHGMCVHFATAFAQCALALGYNARQIILRHHFIADVWSNEYGKWVVMDVEAVNGEGFKKHGTALYLDAKTRKPMDVLELHRAVHRATNKSSATVDDVIQMYYMDNDKGEHTLYEKKRPPRDMAHFLRLAYPRRNNYLDQLEPWEEFHGQDHYHSDAYLWWQGKGPRGWERQYSLQTKRQGDIAWTVNQAELSLTAREGPGQLIVTVETVTPNFKEFLYSVNQGSWQRLAGRVADADSGHAKLVWRLQPGKNVIAIKPRNAFGRDGVTSVAEVVMPEARQ